MKTIPECFKIIISGDKNASNQASRQVRKILYNSQYPRGKNKYEDIKSILGVAPLGFLKITEEWRQVNFTNSISVMYFLRDKDQSPDFLFPWLLQLIQHQNGNIRYAVVRMFENEFGPLTYHIRYPNKEYANKDISPDMADQIILELFANLMTLMDELWQPSYKKFKYISSLPSGPYKSVQMVLGRLEEFCGEEYMKLLGHELEYF